MSMNIDTYWILYFTISVLLALAVIAANTEDTAVDKIKGTAFYFILFLVAPALILLILGMLAEVFEFYKEIGGIE